MRPLERELTRRGLLAGAGAAAFALSGMARAAQALELPPLLPDARSVRATMAAFADTIVPGPAGGADPDPGAIEAGALEEIYEPFYGVSPVFPLLHEDLQLATPRVLGRLTAFDLELPYDDRERVVIDRITATGDGGLDPLYVLYIGTATLVYLSYYGTARSDLGPRYIGFPPESDGYFPDHSHRVAFEGMTEDGNPP
ncbi:MAG: DUF5987 family protein [Thermoleophilaceae bacterium]